MNDTATPVFTARNITGTNAYQGVVTVGDQLHVCQHRHLDRLTARSCADLRKRAERGTLSPEEVAARATIRRTKDRDGYHWQIDVQGTLTDDEAAGITFRAEPGIILGEHVNVEDAEGTRIGIIKSATYMERAFGPAYVVVSIALR